MGCASSCRKVKPVDYEYLSLPGLVVSGTDAKGRMTLNQYTILADISSGSSGTVQLAQKTGTPEMVAIKSLVRKRFGSLIGTEVAVLTQAHHPNVVRFYEVLDDIHHPLVYIVLEYVNGMPLMKLSDGGVASTPTIPEDRAVMYTQQICCGLEYLHNMQIVHCDLKPENILLTADKQTAKLTDFGVSKIFSNEIDATRKTTGTPIFMAPEMCKGEVFSSKAADVWAFGITLYSILYGVTPFRSTNQIQLFYSIQFDPITYEGKEKFSKECNSLLDRMLERDVLKRITLPEVRDHPWITGLKAPIRHQVPDPPALHCTPHLRPCVIPAVQRLCGPDPSFASFATQRSTVFTWASTPNVLIVDDVYLSREIVKKLLQQYVVQDINVECCTDGESAVKFCMEKRFVLVFMDVHLGNMDGCQATSLIRKYEENLQMPRSYIMGLTADPHENIRELCCSAGMDGVLQKPITPAKLVEVLQRCRLKCHPYHPGQGLQGLDRDHAYNKAYIKYLESLGEQVSPTPTINQVALGSKETSLTSSSPPGSPQQPKLQINSILDGTLYFFESKSPPVHKPGTFIEKQNQLLKAMDEIIREDEAT